MSPARAAMPLEPLAFLRLHPPFDRLNEGALGRVGEGLEVVFVPEGATILRRGGAPSEHLYVVRKGAVRLEREDQVVMTLEEGECFGFPSLLGHASPLVDVVALDEVLLYRLPESTFARLLAESTAFAEFFLLDLAARLRRSATAEPIGGGSDLTVPASALATAPVFAGAGMTVGEAARRMREAGVSALLLPGEPPAILTDRDLRSRVLAEDLGPETLAALVATRPVRSLPEEASLFDVLLFMLEHDLHHVPLARADVLVGMVTDSDLLRLHLRSPLHLLREIGKVADPALLGSYAGELASTVEMLAWRGAAASQIGRIVSRLNDTLVARLLALAEAELGPPPCPYRWIVLGSEGRMEQMLITDQDNALVWSADSPAARAYFPRLAERTVAGLLQASFPLCAGGFMATRWAMPLVDWERQFRRWIGTPEPQALLEASNFFDFRAVYGTLDLAPLEQVLAAARDEQVFLARVAQTALGFRPPLGAFHQLRAEHGGINLKAAGILPIVGIARLGALAAGAAVRPTLERLEAAVAAGTLSAESAATLGEGFRFLLRLRLRSQLAAVHRPEQLGGEPPRAGRAAVDLRLEELSGLERRMLKETFLAIREVQEAIALRYGTARLS